MRHPTPRDISAGLLIWLGRRERLCYAEAKRRSHTTQLTKKEEGKNKRYNGRVVHLPLEQRCPSQWKIASSDSLWQTWHFWGEGRNRPNISILTKHLLSRPSPTNVCIYQLDTCQPIIPAVEACGYPAGR